MQGSICWCTWRSCPTTFGSFAWGTFSIHRCQYLLQRGSRGENTKSQTFIRHGCCATMVVRILIPGVISWLTVTFLVRTPSPSVFSTFSLYFSKFNRRNWKKSYGIRIAQNGLDSTGAAGKLTVGCFSLYAFPPLLARNYIDLLILSPLRVKLFYLWFFLRSLWIKKNFK